MNLPAEVARIVQEWLGSHEEARARLRGPHSADRQSDVKLLTCYVFGEMRKRTSQEWDEWSKLQGSVQAEVERLCESLRCSG